MTFWYSWLIWLSLPATLGPHHFAANLCRIIISLVCRSIWWMEMNCKHFSYYTHMQQQSILEDNVRPGANTVQSLADEAYTNSVASEVSVLIPLSCVQQLRHSHCNLKPTLRHMLIFAAVLLKFHLPPSGNKSTAHVVLESHAWMSTRPIESDLFLWWILCRRLLTILCIPRSRPHIKRGVTLNPLQPSIILTFNYDATFRDATVALHDCTNFFSSWSIVSTTVIWLETKQAKLKIWNSIVLHALTDCL